MTEQRPSKDLVREMRLVGYHDWANAVEGIRRELDKLRIALTGIASCSTCEACRGAATLALGAAQPPRDGQ
jgi:hypothetical protein